MMRTHGLFLISISFIGSYVAAQPVKPVDRDTIQFIQSLRNADGGYAPAPGTSVQSSLRATGACIRAMKYLGGTLADVPGTAKFVENCFDKKAGGFAEFPGEAPSVPMTTIGAIAAADLKLSPEFYREGVIKFLDANPKTMEDIRIAAAGFESLRLPAPSADAWLKRIAADRNPDGTFGAGAGLTRATGGTTAMILRLGGTVEHRDAVIKALRAGQRSDGGFGSAERDGSDLESTYRVMRSLAMLKESPADSAKLRAFITKCRSATGGYGVQPGQPPTAVGTYFAATVTHWLDEMAAR